MRYLTSFSLLVQESLGLSFRWADAGSAIRMVVLKNKTKPAFIVRKVTPGSCEEVKHHWGAHLEKAQQDVQSQKNNIQKNLT